jgi:multiple sugar transport system substrate-binding protein
MKRLATLAAILVLVVGLCALAAFAIRRGRADVRTDDGRLVLEYWEGWTGIEAAAMQAVIDDYNASQSRVFVRMLNVSQLDQKLMLAISADRPPDIAGLGSYNLNVYADKGALTPLDRRVKAAGITGDAYIPAFWNLCRHRGFTWALPSASAVLALHWNRAIFREAGLSEDQPPTSIAELDSMAERLTIVRVVENGKAVQKSFAELTDLQRSTHGFTIVRLGFAPTVPGWWNPMWGAWFGGTLWDGRGSVTPDSPENLAAFEWFASYSRKYGVDNLREFSSSFGNFASPQDAFLSGKVAMVLQGVWMQNFIQKYAPKLEWAAAPFPSVDPAKLHNVTIVETNVLVIPRGSRHPDEAFEFIRFVNTRPEIEKLALGQRKISPLIEVSPDFFQRHVNPFARMYTELARSPNTFTVPGFGLWNEYSDDLVAACEQIGSVRQPPQVALATVRERMQRKLDRANARWSLVGEKRIESWRELDVKP